MFILKLPSPSTIVAFLFAMQAPIALGMLNPMVAMLPEIKKVLGLFIRRY